MRFFAVLTVFAAFLLLCGGCGKHYKVIHGVRYEVLSPEEENEMKSMARTALGKSKALSARERELIKTMQPELKIRYTGDRMGDASVVWTLPDRTVTLLMRGAFFNPSSQWMMKIRDKQPEDLDLRRNAPRKLEKR